MRQEILTVVETKGANWHGLWADSDTRPKARELLIALWPKVGATIVGLSAATGVPQSTLKAWRRADATLRAGTPTRPGRRYPPREAANDARTTKRASGE
jgi:hypothetical protein